MTAFWYAVLVLVVLFVILEPALLWLFLFLFALGGDLRDRAAARRAHRLRRRNIDGPFFK